MQPLLSVSKEPVTSSPYINVTQLLKITVFFPLAPLLLFHSSSPASYLDCALSLMFHLITSLIFDTVTPMLNFARFRDFSATKPYLVSETNVRLCFPVSIVNQDFSTEQQLGSHCQLKVVQMDRISVFFIFITLSINKNLNLFYYRQLCMSCCLCISCVHDC